MGPCEPESTPADSEAATRELSPSPAASSAVSSPAPPAKTGEKKGKVNDSRPRGRKNGGFHEPQKGE